MISWVERVLPTRAQFMLNFLPETAKVARFTSELSYTPKSDNELISSYGKANWQIGLRTGTGRPGRAIIAATSRSCSCRYGTS